MDTARRELALAQLKNANRVRIARAEIKRAVAVGELDVRALLQHPPADCLRMDVDELLMAMPRWGQHRVARLLNASVGQIRNRQLGRLTERQRAAIAAELP